MKPKLKVGDQITLDGSEVIILKAGKHDIVYADVPEDQLGVDPSELIYDAKTKEWTTKF